MEAIVSLGTTIQAGSSLPPGCKQRGFFVPRNASPKPSSVSVAYGRLGAEHQQRLGVSDGARGRKNAISDRSTTTALVPLFLRSDAAAVAAEHPKLAEPFMFAKDIRCFHHICHCQQTDQETAEEAAEVSEETWGVQIAIAVLRFYKREISSLLPGSCRYVPTCSEYSMQAYRTYGVLKGTVLTAWRLARCNPFGGSGFDPPRWFGESKPPPF